MPLVNLHVRSARRCVEVRVKGRSFCSSLIALLDAKGVTITWGPMVEESAPSLIANFNCSKPLISIVRINVLSLPLQTDVRPTLELLKNAGIKVSHLLHARAAGL